MGLFLKGEALKIIVKLFLILWKSFRVPFIKKIFEKLLRESLKILRSTMHCNFDYAAHQVL